MIDRVLFIGEATAVLEKFCKCGFGINYQNTIDVKIYAELRR